MSDPSTDPKISELTAAVTQSWRRFLEVYEPPAAAVTGTILPWERRMKTALGSSSAVICMMLAIGCHLTHEERSTMTSDASPRKSGHLPVNGIRMYHEIHGGGGGVPLVLLHGGGSTIDVTYGRVLPLFARHRTVIAVEEQGHGRTTDRDAPVRFDTSADDVAALLDQLRVERADIMGFSNGASVAMQVAIRHPARVRKLVFASSMTKRSGAAPQFWEFMARATFDDMPQPLKDAFLKVNPDPRKLRAMHDKDVERMQHFAEISDDEVRGVSAPTLVLVGDRDVPTPEHAVELTRLLPHSNLIVLPGGHGEYLGELVVATQPSRYPAWTVGLIEDFLDRDG